MNAKAKRIVAVVVLWIVTEVAAKVMIVVPLVMMMTEGRTILKLIIKNWRLWLTPVSLLLPVMSKGITSHLVCLHFIKWLTRASKATLTRTKVTATSPTTTTLTTSTRAPVWQLSLASKNSSRPLHPPSSLLGLLLWRPDQHPESFYYHLISVVDNDHFRYVWVIYSLLIFVQFQIMGLSLVWFHVVCCQRFGILPPPLADWSLPDDWVQCGLVWRRFGFVFLWPGLVLVLDIFGSVWCEYEISLILLISSFSHPPLAPWSVPDDRRAVNDEVISRPLN